MPMGWVLGSHRVCASRDGIAAFKAQEKEGRRVLPDNSLRTWQALNRRSATRVLEVGQGKKPQLHELCTWVHCLIPNHATLNQVKDGGDLVAIADG